MCTPRITRPRFRSASSNRGNSLTAMKSGIEKIGADQHDGHFGPGQGVPDLFPPTFPRPDPAIVPQLDPPFPDERLQVYLHATAPSKSAWL